MQYYSSSKMRSSSSEAIKSRYVCDDLLIFIGMINNIVFEHKRISENITAISLLSDYIYKMQADDYAIYPTTHLTSFIFIGERVSVQLKEYFDKINELQHKSIGCPEESYYGFKSKVYYCTDKTKAIIYNNLVNMRAVHAVFTSLNDGWIPSYNTLNICHQYYILGLTSCRAAFLYKNWIYYPEIEREGIEVFKYDTSPIKNRAIMYDSSFNRNDFFRARWHCQVSLKNDLNPKQGR